MRSSRYLKSLDIKKILKKTFLRFNFFNNKIFFLLILLAAFTCSSCYEPQQLYENAEISDEITNLCKKEYNLDVTVKLVENTIWVYIPLKNFLDDNLGIDPRAAEEINNVSLNISRTLLNTKNPPEFYVLAASDINVGADYFLIGYVYDIIKYQRGFISHEDFMDRHIHNFSLNPKAIGDATGSHIEMYDILLADFIAEQISQRIELKLQKYNLSNPSDTKMVKSKFENNAFKFVINIDQKNQIPEGLDVIKEATKEAFFVINSYNFKNYDSIDITDLNAGKSIQYGREAIEGLK